MPDEPLNWSTATPAALRQSAAAQMIKQMPPDVDIRPLAATSPFRGGLLCAPNATDQTAQIAYFHGGGFVTGSPEERQSSTAWTAAITGCPVWSFRYGLAPEQGWQSIAEDAATALRYLFDRHPAPTPIILAGDSAGVSVALWGLAGLTPAERLRIRAGVFFYGAFGDPAPASAARLGSIENGLDLDALQVMYARLGSHPPKAGQTDIWPNVPCMTVVGDVDPLLDESRAWHAKIQKQAPAGTYLELAAQPHGFLKSAASNPDVQGALRQCRLWLEHVIPRQG